MNKQEVKMKKFGRFEAFQYFLALVPILFTALSYANFVFAAAPTKYRCLIPECEDTPVTFHPKWWKGNIETIKCRRPRLPSNGDCSALLSETEACNRWAYEDNLTIVSEFDLACKEWQRTLVGTVHNIGVFFAMPLIGVISDRLGRRTAIIFCGLTLVTGALKTLVGYGKTAYLIYMGIEFVEAVVVSGTYTVAFVYMLELVGKERRIVSALALGAAITIGELSLALIAFLVPYWRHFMLIVYLPGFLFISYFFFLEESLRWLITNGKKEKALALAKRNARCNKEPEPDKLEVDEEKEEAVEEFSLKLLFSSPVMLRRLLVCSWWWFSAAFVYYGLIINSVFLPGSKYVNFSLSAFATFPGDLTAFFCLPRLGRKKTLLLGFLFCSICCLANGLIPDTRKVPKIVMFVLGKVSISLCFNVIYTYTSELMPTSARSSLVGTCSMVARVGSIFAPLTPLLSEIWKSLPTVLFSGTALCAAALTLQAPETANRELPDTMAEAAAMKD